MRLDFDQARLHGPAKTRAQQALLLFQPFAVLVEAHAVVAIPVVVGDDLDAVALLVHGQLAPGAVHDQVVVLVLRVAADLADLQVFLAVFVVVVAVYVLFGVVFHDVRVHVEVMVDVYAVFFEGVVVVIEDYVGVFQLFQDVFPVFLVQNIYSLGQESFDVAYRALLRNGVEAFVVEGVPAFVLLGEDVRERLDLVDEFPFFTERRRFFVNRFITVQVALQLFVEDFGDQILIKNQFIGQVREVLRADVEVKGVRAEVFDSGVAVYRRQVGIEPVDQRVIVGEHFVVAGFVRGFVEPADEVVILQIFQVSFSVEQGFFVCFFLCFLALLNLPFHVGYVLVAQLFAYVQLP